MSKPPQNPNPGILLVDKPQGITSHDVVSRARKLLGTRKVGHAGTLDPMATGLLILGVNAATRLLTFIVGLDKQYTATVRLGAASSTDDAEGELSPSADAAALARVTDKAIAAGANQLTGHIRQRPSSVSAIKVDGKRAYALVREGATVELPDRPVTVSSFEILEIRRGDGMNGDGIDVDVRVECSSGTYIRALARDLGEGLGVGGHLTALRRTRIGPFDVAASTTLDETLASRMLSPAGVAEVLYPRLDLSADEAADLTHGKRIRVPNGVGVHSAIAPDGRLVGLIEVVDGRAVVLANFPAVEGAE